MRNVLGTGADQCLCSFVSWGATIHVQGCHSHQRPIRIRLIRVETEDAVVMKEATLLASGEATRR
eukprot:3922604-Amphidinium_carterae.1